MKWWSEHPRALAILKSDRCGRYTMSYLRQNNLRAAVFLAPLLITVSALAQTPAPTSTNLEQSKKELNEAARAYREGNFSEAQQHSERALQLDPQSQVAPFFIARTIHAQYNPEIELLKSRRKHAKQSLHIRMFFYASELTMKRIRQSPTYMPI